jgi:hypothetical protein
MKRCGTNSFPGGGVSLFNLCLRLLERDLTFFFYGTYDLNSALDFPRLTVKKFVPYKSQLLSDLDYDYLTDPKPPSNRNSNENKEILFKEKILKDAASVKTVNLSSTQEGISL